MAYRDDREALLNKVQVLERALGKERGEREAASEERERLAEELAAVRRELARFQVPVQGASHARWAATIGALVLAATTTLLVARRASAPALVAVPMPVAPMPAPLPTLTPPPSVSPLRPIGVVDELPPPTSLSPSPDPTDHHAQPSRIEVQQTLQAARERMRACLGNRSGRANVRIVFSGPTGGVAAATITNATALTGTAAERCILREARGAHVEPFENPSLTVTYPFSF